MEIVAIKLKEEEEAAGGEKKVNIKIARKMKKRLPKKEAKMHLLPRHH